MEECRSQDLPIGHVSATRYRTAESNCRPMDPTWRPHRMASSRRLRPILRATRPVQGIPQKHGLHGTPPPTTGASAFSLTRPIEATSAPTEGCWARHAALMRLLGTVRSWNFTCIPRAVLVRLTQTSTGARPPSLGSPTYFPTSTHCRRSCDGGRLHPFSMPRL